MFHPLPVFVGLRYVRTRRQGFFVSFISWISMAGVCLGVAALITIISVMNGFEGELSDKGRRSLNGWKNDGLPWSYELDKAKMYFPR